MMPFLALPLFADNGAVTDTTTVHGRATIEPDDKDVVPEKPIEETGEDIVQTQAAPTDVATRVSIVQGYNTDVEQSQATLNGPVVRHPSPFTGAEGMIQLRKTYERSQHDVRLQLRGQHYEPLDHYDESDDGTVNLATTNAFELSRVDILRINGFGTLSKLNSARITDGVIYQFDPTRLDNTFAILDGQSVYIHQISSNWRITAEASLIGSTTIYEPPVVLQNGQKLDHRGLDYLQPEATTWLAHDFDTRNIGDIRFAYQYTYTPVVFIFPNGATPVNVGPESTQIGTFTFGWDHLFSEDLRTFTRLGGTIGSPPPTSANTRPTFEPAAVQELWYSRDGFLVHLNVSYLYGAIDPRLGAGATIAGNVEIIGSPFRRRPWSNLSMIIVGRGSHTSVNTGSTVTVMTMPEPVVQSTELGSVAGTAQIRVGLNDWLGLLGGYDIQYAAFAGSTQFPPILRHVFYLGLAGFWSTDHTLPSLTSISPPVRPY